MLVRDENGNFETTTSSTKLTINEEFEKSRRYPIMDTNNNHDTNNNNNNAQLVTSDDVSMTDRSSIKSFYRNACILVTGGTGFVGKGKFTANNFIWLPQIEHALLFHFSVFFLKVLLEKLLRTCDNLQCIYVLLRSKRGLSSEERYHELIQNPVISFLIWPNNCANVIRIYVEFVFGIFSFLIFT